MKYRAEIDGLRALAVVPVVIYHLKIPFMGGYIMQGGFLGVDIFFVISGFLITKILLEEISVTGSLSITRFYIRRVRRILPALLLVILASTLMAIYLLTPTEITRFSESSVAALGFVSNAFWFFQLEEYGAQSGLLQPLLHTWSLAIEEQFYLVLPFLLIMLKPARRGSTALLLLLGLIFLSLITAEVTTKLISKELSFYSPFSRAWELLFGSILATLLIVYPNTQLWGKRIKMFAPTAASIVLFVCMLFIDLDRASHPGIVTVPVVLSTGVIIWFAHKGEFTTTVLSSSPFVYVGKLSYSIYLWHFPIFAFGRLTSFDVPGALDMIVWLLLTLALSIVGFHLVERPLRHAASLRAVLTSVSVAVGAILTLFLVNAQTDLLKSVNSEALTALYGGPYFDNELLRDETWTILDQLAPEEKIDVWNAHSPSDNEKDQLWFHDESSPNFLIVGNSHSKDLFNALQIQPRKRYSAEYARFGMGSEFPESQLNQLIESPNFDKADVIIIAPRYSDEGIVRLPHVISRFQELDKLVVIAGNTAEFEPWSRLPIYDNFIQRRGSRKNLIQMNELAFRMQRDVVFRRNARIRIIANDLGIIYLSRTALVCPPKNESCTLSTHDGVKTMYDNTHWTLDGASYFGRVANEINWLAPVYEAICKKQYTHQCDQ